MNKHSGLFPDPGWPTCEQAAASRLFQPIRIGRRLEARTRTWVPAMVPWRATEDGLVTPDNIGWYERFARGLPGVLVVEATGIRDIPSGPLLRIGHDRFLPGLEKMVEAVRRASGGRTKFLIQLIDFLAIRRRPTPEKFFGKYLVVTDEHRHRLAGLLGGEEWKTAEESAIRQCLLELDDSQRESVLDAREFESFQFGYRERVWDMDKEHIRDLPQVLPGLFADAAERAQRAGFDGVELHFAHAYTMASFLSRLNDRDDGYGGTRENRVRMALEVVEAVRERVGEEYCVGCRYLGDEVIEGGTRIDDATWYGIEFARAGVDFLSVSKGGKFEDARRPAQGWAVYPYTGPSGLECMPTVRIDEKGPFGRNVPLAAAIRRGVNDAGFEIPVVTSGGLCSFDQAEAVLENGEADIIGAARQSLADPDWWLKMEKGRGAEIVRCEYTNYCEGLDQKHKEVTCRLWDKQFSEAEKEAIPMSRDGRRRLLAPAWSV